ncbi:hypothetical protein PI124_g12371 [Phytophthora idaei]|nr:hypothetical protein PI125_g11230 [Phytophthora idaei]KAG3148964.1 hypothetical protein PI126_g12236 [Phytophthora idaei]KAG3242808.1 hypothetical protein PI124_g12371 [Phytophthora idaei]
MVELELVEEATFASTSASVELLEDPQASVTGSIMSFCIEVPVLGIVQSLNPIVRTSWYNAMQGPLAQNIFT